MWRSEGKGHGQVNQRYLTQPELIPLVPIAMLVRLAT